MAKAKHVKYNQRLAIELGHMVYNARISQRYSMQALGELVGTNRHHISKIEQGRSAQVTFPVVMRLAEVLDFSLDSLKQTVLS